MNESDPFVVSAACLVSFVCMRMRVHRLVHIVACSSRHAVQQCFTMVVSLPQRRPCLPFDDKAQAGRLMSHCKFYDRKLGLVVLDSK